MTQSVNPLEDIIEQQPVHSLMLNANEVVRFGDALTSLHQSGVGNKMIVVSMPMDHFAKPYHVSLKKVLARRFPSYSICESWDDSARFVKSMGERLSEKHVRTLSGETYPLIVWNFPPDQADLQKVWEAANRALLRSVNKHTVLVVILSMETSRIHEVFCRSDIFVDFSDCIAESMPHQFEKAN